ncbi:hypothetical protein [Streptomyces sp. cmx-10-25]|uniref:hypothetical protein n=1 Tax=Streptomyces sp. cmx-10-25 TaxID=2790919 RepID=UPI00397FD14A
MKTQLVRRYVTQVGSTVHYFRSKAEPGTVGTIRPLGRPVPVRLTTTYHSYHRAFVAEQVGSL